MSPKNIKKNYQTPVSKQLRWIFTHFTSLHLFLLKVRQYSGLIEMLRYHCKLVFTCVFKPPNYPFQKLSAKKYDKASLLLYSGQCKPAFSKTMTKACLEKVSALHQCLLLYLAVCVYFQHHYRWSCGSFYFPIKNVDFNYVMDSRNVGLKQCNIN